MEREDVFDLLEDASEEKIERLESYGLLTRHIQYTDDGVEETYALTEPGMEHFELEY